MVGLFRAINSGSCRQGIAERKHYNFFSRNETEKICIVLHRSADGKSPDKKSSADAEKQRLERVVGVRFGALRGVERWRLGDIYRDAGNANPDLRLMRTSD